MYYLQNTLNFVVHSCNDNMAFYSILFNSILFQSKVLGKHWKWFYAICQCLELFTVSWPGDWLRFFTMNLWKCLHSVISTQETQYICYANSNMGTPCLAVPTVRNPAVWHWYLMHLFCRDYRRTDCCGVLLLDHSCWLCIFSSDASQCVPAWSGARTFLGTVKVHDFRPSTQINQKSLIIQVQRSTRNCFWCGWCHDINKLNKQLKI